MSFVYWIPLLVGCATVPSPAPVAGADAATVRASDVGPPPVSFVPLEERVNVLIAEAQETDRRDRLIAARDLMQTMRNKDPIAQRKVFEYLDAVLKIEERNSAAPIGMEPIGTPIEEEPLGVPALVAPPVPVAPTAPATAPVPVAPPAAADPAAILATARVALADARYLFLIS